MQTGIKGKETLLVTEANTALAMGSGTLPVFATPAMAALMEHTAYTSLEPYLEEGQGTVGTLLDIRHTAPTPVGMTVTCETTLTEIDRKRLVFQVTVSDSKGMIGEGVHERFLIDNQRFLSKAKEKLQ